MYHCKECNKNFDNLLEFQKNDKMFQLCPNCKSEDIVLLTKLSEADRIRFIRENKLDRTLKEK